MTPQKLRALVQAHYRKHGRHTLPWRTTHNPYRILVSEVMLQQTQVDRVLPYYKSFLKRFPTVAALAKAPLSDVLQAWQGLGYNRRAKMLHEAAKAVVKEHGGRMPRTKEALEALPGVGPYTAGAVAAFAYNEDVLIIETNIRTVILHHLFDDREKVSDIEVLAALARATPKGSAREWYWALMDYGSYLKKNGVRINNKSTGYTKQSAFKGSSREVRGAILRTLLTAPRTKEALLKLFSIERSPQVVEQIDKLLLEGLIQKKGRFYTLPS